MEFHLIYCQFLTLSFNYWFRYWEEKKKKRKGTIKQTLRETPCFPLLQAQLQPNISPPTLPSLSLFWQTLECDVGQYRRSGSVHRGLFLLPLASYWFSSTPPCFLPLLCPGVGLSMDPHPFGEVPAPVWRCVSPAVFHTWNHISALDIKTKYIQFLALFGEFLRSSDHLHFLVTAVTVRKTTNSWKERSQVTTVPIKA